MNDVKTISDFCSSMLEELLEKIFDLINCARSYKNLRRIIENNKFNIIGETELKEIINKIYPNCSIFDEPDFDSPIKMKCSFDQVNTEIFSMTYQNIFKFKIYCNYSILRELYVSSYLLQEISKIPVKERESYQFDQSKFIQFEEGMKFKFKNGINVDIDDNGVKTFNYMDVQEDVSTLCWLFWRYCTIKSLFDRLNDNFKYELVRILHNDIDIAKKFKSKLLLSKEVKNTTAIKLLASSGGKAKAKNYKIKMEPLFQEVYQLYKNGNPEENGKKWKSKNKCAQYFIKSYYLKNKDNAIELDAKRLVDELTKKINGSYTSK